jgi:ATP-dependent DNA ligase
MIEPVLLSEIDDQNVLDRKDRLFQIKRNGFRALMHVKNYKPFGIFNRSGAPCKALFPEISGVTLSIEEGILDGEVVVMKNNKDAYYGGIDGRRSVPTKKTLEESPAKFVVFDALKINGENLLMKPYKYRLEKLQATLKNLPTVELIETFTDGRALWERIIKEDLEGIVIRNPMAVYELGKRSKDGVNKLKNYKHVKVKITKTEANSKGTKIYGEAVIGDKNILVEAQIQSDFNIQVGDERTIKYLDIVGNRLVQPTGGHY